ncbi:3-dehydroquinate synthase [Mangrovimonas aestuarii]|uniref:3-dehydroquinate synthase n=1 Tax=Mangrovimonas aestuarii TaxID=3018443 RepID=UPI002379896C|nr:3-dehydroquinate synthase [Mangrovimonas aestuarii]
MTTIQAETYPIHFNENCNTEINSYLKNSDHSQIYVVVDENTHQYCLSQFLATIETKIAIEIIEIEAGESHKNIETCMGVWNALSELGADRKSLVINLGGGTITDLGGFVASTFRRGIKYINVPTTLLSMVDASIGGKTGVDLNGLKNQIGVINTPEMVLINTTFLNTLPTNEMRSGLAEMFKHALISNYQCWHRLNGLPKLTLEDLDSLIHESILIKKTIVEQDPTEEGLRKTLNFGHTLGHAIETYCLTESDKESLLHGEAIAVGMILACYLSKELFGFPEQMCNEVKNTLQKYFGKIHFNTEDQIKIIELLKYDKKNTYGNINFVLLENIGKPLFDQKVSNRLIIKAFNYYAI